MSKIRVRKRERLALVGEKFKKLLTYHLDSTDGSLPIFVPVRDPGNEFNERFGMYFGNCKKPDFCMNMDRDGLVKLRDMLTRALEETKPNE